MSRQTALEYLRTPKDAPWRWEEAGRVLTWQDGATIAFREEVELVLQRLAPSGLPPFPSLVVLLAACRGKISESIPSTANAGGGRGQLLLALRTRRHQQVADQLSRLTTLPRELIASGAGKALLAEVGSERMPRRSPSESNLIIQGLVEVWDDDALNRPVPDAARFDLELTVSEVADAVRPHTAESLVRRLRTGLEALPVAIPTITLPRAERMRRLLETMSRDAALAGLTRVVRDLMAALRLPRTLTQADEIAGGGASDLGNRGPLDRLLLSELAHDDLTLATRVALNEALYLRREPPARRPERSLGIVLDVGLRMWGVPRVLGAAAALALITRHPFGGSVRTWRASGRELTPVDLLDKAQLEAHLAELGTDLNPASALPSLEVELAAIPEVDLVIVTHRDGLGDPDFRAQLAQLTVAQGYLLLVERDGRVQLHALPWGSPRPLAETKVHLADLFPVPKRRPIRPLVAPGAEDFPAIFRLPIFPLLLPVNAKMERSIAVGAGGICTTVDRRLLAWEKSESGARQLATDLPGGRTSWLHRDRTGRVIALKGRGSDGSVSVTIASADGTKVQRAQFSGPHQPPAAWVDGEMLLVALHTRIVAIALATGEVHAEIPIPADLRWINGRYFSRDRGLVFASWQGSSGIRWDSLLVGATLSATEVLAVFDRDGVGAWVVTRAGEVLGPSGGEWMKTGFAIDLARVAPGGAEVIVSRSRAATWHQLDLIKKKMIALPKGPTRLESAEVFPPTRTLQHRFVAVTGGPHEPLRLRHTKGRWLEVFMMPDRTLQLVEAKSPGFPERSFAAVSTPPRLGCTLRVAEWPAGSRAWLDSRGVLHLRSHDPSLPELSLVLCFQSALAIWCSDGAQTGPAFYLGLGAKQEPERVQDALKRFCAQLC